MEIIDCFCGIGPWQRRDRLLPYKQDEILGLMDHFGVTKALVHSNFVDGGGSAIRGNRFLAETCMEVDRFVPAFTLMPHPYEELPGLDAQLDSMRAAGSKAVWLWPSEGMTPSWLYGELFRECERRKIPVLLHMDRLKPADINEIGTQYPGLRMILVGLSYREDYWLFPLLRQFESLHVCLGHLYMPSFGPMRFLENFPAERLLFGSGLPQFSPGGLITHVMYADISDEDRAKILSGNFKRLLAEVEL